MFDQVTNQAIMWKLIGGGIGILLPVFLLLAWKKKTGCNLKPAIVGAIIFLVFSQMLEGIPKFIFFIWDTPIADYVWTHVWAYVLIGCLLAGIFEEVGRFVAFRFLLKKNQQPRDAITYGIGHWGFEAILILGLMGIGSISMAAAINNGSYDEMFRMASIGQQETMMLQATALAGYSFGGMLLDVLERMIAMSLHIALSIVVFQSVKEKRMYYLFVAIILHAVFDIPAALYQCSVIGRGVVEIWLLVSLIGICFYSKKLYGQEKKHELFKS